MCAEELEEEGYEVITTGRCKDVLELITSRRPSAVILDIRMEDCDGLDLLQDIRSEFYDLPVILCSAYDSYRDSLKAIAADYYVVKSADLDELKQKVRMCLGLQVETYDAVISDLLKKKGSSVVEKEYDRFLEEISNRTATTPWKCKPFLDLAIENLKRVERALSLLCKLYRDMVMRGDITLKKIPNYDTVKFILGNQPGLERALHPADSNTILSSIADEYRRFSKELATLTSELRSTLAALDQCRLDRISNYENLKRVLSLKEENYSPVLLGEGFGIILDDFFHDLKNTVRSINDLIDDAEEKVSASVEAGSPNSMLSRLSQRLLHGPQGTQSLYLQSAKEKLTAMKQRTRDVVQLVQDVQHVPFLRTLNPESVDFKACTDEIVSQLVFSDNIEFDVLTDPAELSLTTDRSLFSIIMKNVIKNAIEAMSQGGRLTIGAIESKEKELVTIHVSDTGHGIPANAIQKVFDLRFSMRKDKRGRGMGLYIAKKATSRATGRATGVKSFLLTNGRILLLLFHGETIKNTISGSVLPRYLPG